MALHGGGGGNASTTYKTSTSGSMHGGTGGEVYPSYQGTMAGLTRTIGKLGDETDKWVSNTWADTGAKVKETSENVFGPMLSALMTSAIEADRQAAKEVNDFNAKQAELNRIFQQESAQKAMDFEANQAELNRTFQQNSAQKAMDFEALWNQKAMDYNERMASTQYQRAVQDLKAAGLSPLLAYANLSGSSPTISTASGQTAAGSMASGRAASGSQASGVKASPSSAKQADLQLLTRLAGVLETGMSSAVSLARVIALL